MPTCLNLLGDEGRELVRGALEAIADDWSNSRPSMVQRTSSASTKMWGRGADCRRLVEERMVALDFRCDESRDFFDRCRPSMIFVNVQVIGARKRHLLGQHRNERWVARCDESGQHAKATS